MGLGKPGSPDRISLVWGFCGAWQRKAAKEMEIFQQFSLLMPRNVPRRWEVNALFDICVLRAAAELRGRKEEGEFVE